MDLNTYTEFQNIIKAEVGRGAEERSSDSYCVYWVNTKDGHPRLDDIVFIGDHPVIIEEEDNKEVFPQEVVDKGWWLCYRDELIQDVIDNALYQNPEASIAQLNEAIVYYSKHDCFKNLKGS